MIPKFKSEFDTTHLLHLHHSELRKQDHVYYHVWGKLNKCYCSLVQTWPPLCF